MGLTVEAFSWVSKLNMGALGLVRMLCCAGCTIGRGYPMPVTLATGCPAPRPKIPPFVLVCSYRFHLSGNNRRNSHFMGS